MTQGEHDTKVKPSVKLRNEFSTSLSIMDFARVIELIRQLRTWESDGLKTHMHVGENGHEIPDSLNEAEAAVKKLGGFEELDYFSASLPDKFVLNADFRNNKIIVRSSTSTLLSRIKNEWDHLKTHTADSINLAPLSMSLSARRFILDSIDRDGTISEISKKKLPISKFYILTGLKEVGLSRILGIFAHRLMEVQNNDGGWSDTSDKSSDLIPTASAILMLSSLSQEAMNPDVRSSISDGLTFLNKSRDSVTIQTLHDYYSLLLVRLSLIATGKLESMDTSSNTYSVQALANKVNPVLLSLMTKFNLLNQETMEELHNRIIYDFLNGRNDSVNSFATVLNIVSTRSNMFKLPTKNIEYRILEYLVKRQNRDGGWPENQHEWSSLTMTINVLLALNQFSRYMKG